jgi:hypothetical protein
MSIALWIAVPLLIFVLLAIVGTGSLKGGIAVVAVILAMFAAGAVVFGGCALLLDSGDPKCPEGYVYDVGGYQGRPYDSDVYGCVPE